MTSFLSSTVPNASQSRWNHMELIRSVFRCIPFMLVSLASAILAGEMARLGQAAVHGEVEAVYVSVSMSAGDRLRDVVPLVAIGIHVFLAAQLKDGSRMYSFLFAQVALACMFATYFLLIALAFLLLMFDKPILGGM